MTRETAIQMVMEMYQVTREDALLLYPDEIAAFQRLFGAGDAV